MKCKHTFCAFVSESKETLELDIHEQSCPMKPFKCKTCDVEVPSALLSKHMKTHKTTDADEPILTQDNRLILFPIKDWGAWNLAKKAEASIWHASEVAQQIPGDLADWESLQKGEKDFIKSVLSFFSASDALLIDNLARRFLEEVQSPEARGFYTVQIMIEQVHSETYAILIDSYITDDKEKNKLFKAIETNSTIKAKADWTLRWIDGSESFAERLVAFACIEGIFFSSSFCAIFWLKKRGKMHALCLSNELISKDEALHTVFAQFLYKNLKHKLSSEKVKEIVTNAVLLEQEFVKDSLKTDLIGINAKMMCQYVEFVADHMFVELGLPRFYNTQNPFQWMELISIGAKNNFFERQVSDYAVSNMMTQTKARQEAETKGLAKDKVQKDFLAETDF